MMDLSAGGGSMLRKANRNTGHINKNKKRSRLQKRIDLRMQKSRPRAGLVKRRGGILKPPTFQRLRIKGTQRKIETTRNIKRINRFNPTELLQPLWEKHKSKTESNHQGHAKMAMSHGIFRKLVDLIKLPIKQKKRIIELDKINSAITIAEMDSRQFGGINAPTLRFLIKTWIGMHREDLKKRGISEDKKKAIKESVRGFSVILENMEGLGKKDYTITDFNFLLLEVKIELLEVLDKEREDLLGGRLHDALGRKQLDGATKLNDYVDKKIQEIQTQNSNAPYN